MFKEFKNFILKGNVIELAVAVIVGGAFGKIIGSLVDDVITPIVLQPTLQAAGVGSIEEWAPGGIFWGKFIAAILSFVVISVVLFLLVKAANTANPPAPEAPPAPAGPSETDLLIEIRDLLKK